MLLALAHATGIWRLPVIDGLDHFIYDTRLRAGMPRTLDPRIVIVDIDDPSLAKIGQWPWSRDKLARLTSELTGRQGVAALGFDVMFVEADQSSALPTLQALASGPLRDTPGFPQELVRLTPQLDHDRIFANALAGQRVALGYYFNLAPDAESPQAKGQLPAPALPVGALPPDARYTTRWNGFGASLPLLAQAAPASGFLNMLVHSAGDGVIRSVPLIARYDGTSAAPGYYEAFALSVYRLPQNLPAATPVFAATGANDPTPPLVALKLGTGEQAFNIPLDANAGMLVPYRGPGGARGGSFRYISAAAVLAGELAPAELQGKIVLVGTTAPGLQDLRPTPVGAAFPGVEVHANILSGLLDRRLPSVPADAAAYEVLTLAVAGLMLAFGLSLVTAAIAAALALAVVGLLIGVNIWLYAQGGLVLPLAAGVVMSALAYAFNMGWGYFVEARARRGLARLFGTYVPPQLVNEMLATPGRYSMRAENRELTVMFCDMRGFTHLSEQMAPADLQAFLNNVFSQLTEIISSHRGTVDKYMGDCVMAFWGAPVASAEHATLAVQAAIEMAAAIQGINQRHRADGYPEISVGIGLNTGVMSVGDMGSAVRRSYTVVGDAVNLASRLEGLSAHYGVELVASDTTRRAAPGFAWLELDHVRVKGKAQVVAIFTPIGLVDQLNEVEQARLIRWAGVRAAYKRQDWMAGQNVLAPLLAADAKNVLYQLYAQRLASMALQPKDPDWDGATRFETK